MEPILYDAVTLRHFATAGRLAVVEARVASFPLPRWTESVRDEIAAVTGDTACRQILAATFLGDAIAAGGDRDLIGIQQIHRGLRDPGDPPLKHLGEAESIYFADRLNGRFVTDDNIAYDQAVRRLGSGRVLDTVDVLREAVAMDDLTADEALLIANAIRNAGRHLRRTHPQTLLRTYFAG